NQGIVCEDDCSVYQFHLDLNGGYLPKVRNMRYPKIPDIEYFLNSCETLPLNGNRRVPLNDNLINTRTIPFGIIFFTQYAFPQSIVLRITCTGNHWYTWQPPRVTCPVGKFRTGAG